MEYRKIDAVNYSTLKHLRPPDGCPARYLYWLNHPKEPTTAMLLGSAVHTAVLEPERFTLEYVVWPGARRGNKFKEFAEYEEGEGRTILTATEYDTCEAIAESVLRCPEAAAILSNGEAEKTLRWTNPDTGIECKGRMDWTADGLIADLKTTHDISPRNFQRHAWYMGAFFQMAMYQEGLEQMQDELAEIAIIAVEQKPPHICVVYRLEDDGVAAAWDEYISCLNLLKQCRESNTWPGPDWGGKLSAPSWILAEADRGLTLGGEEMTL